MNTAIEIEELEGSPVSNDSAGQQSEYAVPKSESQQTDRFEENEKKENVNMDAPECKKLAVFESFVFALQLWVHIILQLAPMLGSVILFMWVYYLPAVILTDQMINQIAPVLYDMLRGVFVCFFYHLAVSSVVCETFSFALSRGALFFVVFPCYVMDLIFHTIPQRHTIWAGLSMNILSFTSGTLAFLLIQNIKKPTVMPPELQEYYDLTKDGTPVKVIKSFLGVFAVGIFIRYFLSLLVNIGFEEQIIFRLIVFPLLFYGVKSYQTYIVQDLSLRQMDKRLMVNRNSLMYVKFIGRIIISNISTVSNVSQYVIINLLVAMIEIITTITHKERLILFYRMKKYASILIATKRAGGKVIPIVPGEIENYALYVKAAKSEKDAYIERHMFIRSLTLFDETSYEVIVAVVAPLFMYFVHRIYKQSSFNTISNFRECIYQIFIQLAFVFLGDIISLAYEIRNGTIEYDPKKTHIRLSHRITSTLFFIFWMIHVHDIIRTI